MSRVASTGGSALRKFFSMLSLYLVFDFRLWLAIALVILVLRASPDDLSAIAESIRFALLAVAVVALRRSRGQ